MAVKGVRMAKEFEQRMQEGTDGLGELLEPTFNARGFAQYPRIAGTYEGHIDVFESSAASSPHLWIRLGDSDLEVIVHLQLADAINFATQIMHAAGRHYQLRDRPQDGGDG